MSSDEQSDKECPLCMEPFEEINFYPCTCQYQICTFCWHRLRTDDNGLCPACRQPYPEQPVNYQPLSFAEIQKLKNEKKQKHLQKNNKLSECGGRKTDRQHLSAFRVLQRNLVYVIGLSQRIADAELLKKNEYFGKFGKIVKVAVGAFQNTNNGNNGSSSSSSNNAQPTSYTAYVTYGKIEDALRAIQAVNNLVVDGRLVKASLGTTKYCSNFLKGQQCHKQECMYLHEVAVDELSFTKDDMHQGKHTEYERKLHEQMLSQLQNSQQNHSRSSSTALTSNNMTNFSTGSPSPLAAMVSGASSSSSESPPPIQVPNTSSTTSANSAPLTNGQSKSKNSGEKNGRREKAKERKLKSTTPPDSTHIANGQSAANHGNDEKVVNNKKNGCVRKDSTKCEVKPPPGFSKIVAEKAPPLLESQMSMPIQGSSAWTMIDEDRHNFQDPTNNDLSRRNEAFGISNSLFSLSSVFPTSTTTTLEQPSSSIEPSSGVESLFQGNFNEPDVDDDELKMKLMSSDSKAVMTCDELERLLLNTTVPPGFNRQDSLNSFSGTATKSSRQTPVPSGMNFFLDLYDDLGFDPFSESSKALADMLEEEKTSSPR